MRCKKQRDLQNELAEECQTCKTEGPKPILEPWGEIDQSHLSETTTSPSDSTIELWDWSDQEKGDTDETDVLIDDGLEQSSAEQNSETKRIEAS